MAMDRNPPAEPLRAKVPLMPTATLLSLSDANVVSADGLNYRRIQIVVDDAGSAELVDQAGFSLGTRDGVQSVDTDAVSGGWLVNFESGEQWTVTRGRGCGCGGR